MISITFITSWYFEMTRFLILMVMNGMNPNVKTNHIGKLIPILIKVIYF